MAVIYNRSINLQKKEKKEKDFFHFWIIMLD